MARFLSALSHKVAFGAQRPGGGRTGGFKAAKRGDRGEAGHAHHTLLVKGIRDRCQSGDTPLHPMAWRWGSLGGCGRRGQSCAMLSICMGCAPGMVPAVPPSPEPHAILRQTVGGHQNQAGTAVELSYRVCGEMGRARTPQPGAARGCRGLRVGFLTSLRVVVPF